MDTIHEIRKRLNLSVKRAYAFAMPAFGGILFFCLVTYFTTWKNGYTLNDDVEMAGPLLGAIWAIIFMVGIVLTLILHWIITGEVFFDLENPYE